MSQLRGLWRGSLRPLQWEDRDETARVHSSRWQRGSLAARRKSAAAIPVIGCLNSAAAAPIAHLLAAFRQGLAETGYVEGQNVAIEYRLAEGQYDRLPALASDLVNRRVSVIAVGGGTVSALAAKTATATIPIVFISDSDPVKIGLVASINRPGGNVTGIHQLTRVITSRRFSD
jgi:putative tryptophan/tyrosine transport system substrate-binding protein